MMLSCSRLLSRQLVVSGPRALAGPVQSVNFIHTTHITRDESTAAGTLIHAAQGMRVIPTRGQAAKEKLYMFVQVGDILQIN